MSAEILNEVMHFDQVKISRHVLKHGYHLNQSVLHSRHHLYMSTQAYASITSGLGLRVCLHAE